MVIPFFLGILLLAFVPQLLDPPLAFGYRNQLNKKTWGGNFDPMCLDLLQVSETPVATEEMK